jgi:hypothetical protein
MTDPQTRISQLERGVRRLKFVNWGLVGALLLSWSVGFYLYSTERDAAVNAMSVAEREILERLREQHRHRESDSSSQPRPSPKQPWGGHVSATYSASPSS